MGPSSVLFALIFLLLLSTFFSLSEAAFIAVAEEKVFKLSKNGLSRAKNLVDLLRHKERVVSVCLLCDNIVNIVASSVSALFFSELFGEENSGYAIATSAVVMTMLIFVFGEVLPKTIGIRIATSAALAVAPIFNLMIKICYPFIYFIEKINNKMINVLQIKNESDIEDAGDSILGAVEMYHQKGSLQEDEKAMLSGVLRLEDVDIKDVMTHRSDMIAVDVNQGAGEFFRKAIASNYSKIPVYQENDDNMLGYIIVKDFFIELNKAHGNVDNVKLEKLIKEPWFIPGDASLSSKIKDFRHRGNIIAFVVDEYGGIMGIATLEDILEQIVGEIYNGTEEVGNNGISKCENDDSYDVKADVNLEYLNEKIGSNFKDPEVSSIAGFVINKMDNIPAIGDIIEIDGYSIQILDRKANRLLQFKISKIDK